MLARATWSPVQQIGGSGESVWPERCRHGGMEKQSAHAIVDGSEHMFSTTILLRRIGASQAQGNAMCGKESARRRVVELPAIVSLKTLNGEAELCANEGMKRDERG